MSAPEISIHDIPKMRQLFQESDRKRDASLTEPTTVEKMKDLTYGPHGVDNTFDIYYPKGTTNALPTIINIHGGGFFYGDKELYRFYTMFLATQGFTVINFNYRLAPAATYPAPLEDTNQLMNWLLRNSQTYFIDLDQLFLIGDSAGGQLAQQYATLTSNPTYAKKFTFPVAKVNFKAVVLNCGVYFIGKDSPINQEFPYYFKEPLSPEIKRQFPVESFITAHFPPTMIVTASHDFLKEGAHPLAKVLQQYHVPVIYHCYENPDGSELGHVFHLDLNHPIGKECNQAELSFLKKFCH